MVQEDDARTPWLVRFAPPFLIVALCGTVYASFWYRELTGDGVYILLVSREPFPLVPGHILYPILGKIAYFLIAPFEWADEKTAFHLLGTGMSVLGLLGFYFTILLVLEDRFTAFLATLLIAFSPGFWRYTEIVEERTTHLCAIIWLQYFLIRHWISLARLGKTVPQIIPFLRGAPTGLFLMAALVVLTYHAFLLWLPGLFLALILEIRKPAVNSPLSTYSAEPSFRVGLWVLIGCSALTLLWCFFDRSLFPLLRTYWAWDLRTHGIPKTFWLLFHQSFGNAFALSVFSLSGFILLLFSALPLVLKVFLTSGLIVHFLFVCLWISDRGVFFLPIYPLCALLSVYFLHRLWRQDPPGSDRAAAVVLACVAAFLFFRVFFKRADLAFTVGVLTLTAALGLLPALYKPGATVRRYPLYACLTVMIILQILKAGPVIFREHAKTERTEIARALAAISKKEDLLVAYDLAPYLDYYSNSEVIHLDKAFGFLAWKSEVSHDEMVVITIEKKLRAGENVFLTFEASRHLAANRGIFPKTQEFFASQVTRSPISRAYHLRLKAQ